MLGKPHGASSKNVQPDGKAHPLLLYILIIMHDYLKLETSCKQHVMLQTVLQS